MKVSVSRSTVSFMISGVLTDSHNNKFKSLVISFCTVAAGVASPDPPVKMSLFSANRAHSNVIPSGHIQALSSSAAFRFTPNLHGYLLPAVIMIRFPRVNIVESMRNLMKKRVLDYWKGISFHEGSRY